MGTSHPTGRITTAATRSLEMAAAGLTENSRISIGVISAPPPAPVSPTSKPTTALPMTTYPFSPMDRLPTYLLLIPKNIYIRPPPVPAPHQPATPAQAESAPINVEL